jgi:hypothetical protein
MKCDEAKPVCWACTKIKQDCSYEADQVQSRVSVNHDAAKVKIPSLESLHDRKKKLNEPELSTEGHHSADSTPTSSTWRLSSIHNERHAAAESVSGKSSLLETLEQTPKPSGLDSMPQEKSPNQESAPMPHTSMETWTNGLVSSIGDVESDTAGWFGLLFGDAVLGNSSLPYINFAAEGLDIFGNSIPEATSRTSSEDPAQRAVSSFDANSRAESSNESLLERSPKLKPEQLLEKQSWQSSEPIKLSPEEQFLFQHFVRHISKWVRTALLPISINFSMITLT